MDYKLGSFKEMIKWCFPKNFFKNTKKTKCAKITLFFVFQPIFLVFKNSIGCFLSDPPYIRDVHRFCEWTKLFVKDGVVQEINQGCTERLGLFREIKNNSL